MVGSRWSYVKPITEEQAKNAFSLVGAYGGLRKASKASGIAYSTLQQQYKRAKEMQSEGVQHGQTKRQLYGMQQENQKLRDEIKTMHRENLDAQEARKIIHGLAEVEPKPPAWLLPSVKGSKSVSGVPCTIWSDWHLGESVGLAETNNVNEFNLAIAEARIRRLVERTIDLCFNHMTKPEYPGIVINLIGDIVSGDIHDELTQTNELEIGPTILWAIDRLIWAIDAMANKFGKVLMVCVPGNHGRTTRKPHAKRYVFLNSDWQIYQHLKRYFAKDGRVSFMIPESGEQLYRVYDHRYMAMHGDDLGVKGGDGIIGSIGPIMRGEIKVHGSSAQIGRDYDTLLIGHWHQDLWLPRCIVNNTLKGYDEYARRVLRAPATAPKQVLWFTHPVWGITARWSIELGTKIENKPAEWASWPEARAA